MGWRRFTLSKLWNRGLGGFWDRTDYIKVRVSIHFIILFTKFSGISKGTMKSDLKHHDLTGKIIRASFQVHKFLGNGFQEVIYQRALAYEFEQAQLSFEREIEQQIFYRDLEQPIGTRRADFVVDQKVLVEIKAVKELEDVHMAQALNYLKAYKLEIGLLINFGSKSMEFKRLILSK
jgi:GxxExxY protein